MSQQTDFTSAKKVGGNGNTSNKSERVKIRCEECNLPFWTEKQLENTQRRIFVEKHFYVHIARKGLHAQIV